MAKLEDLLGKYLPEWPDGAEYAWQDYDGEVRFLGVPFDSFYVKEVADDFIRQVGMPTPSIGVTKSQYLSARDRLHAEAVRDNNQFRESVNHLEKQMRTAEDQRLWDDALINAMPSIINKEYPRCTDFAAIASIACDAVDAMMQERAKRLATK